MTVRYVTEGEFAATFTASQHVKDEEQAYRLKMSLELLNQKAGYKKYSGYILYDDNNQILKRL